MTKKDEKLFEVTIAQEIVKLHDGSGVEMPLKMKSHMNREAIVSTTAKGAETKAIRALTQDMDDDAADAFIDSLKVRVDEVNFPC